MARLSPAKRTFVLWCSLLVALSWGLQAGLTANGAKTRVESGCARYIIIDTRGSGEPKGTTSPPGSRFIGYWTGLHPGVHVRVIRNPYPADGVWSFLGAILRAPGGYHRSVVAGKTWLENELVSLAHCGSSTSILLTGYSQGAQVTGDVVQAMSPPLVLGVVLFGDPSFNSHDPVDHGGFQIGRNGVLHVRPRFSAYWRAHVLSYCHLHDPVCQGPIGNVKYGFSQHKTYGDPGKPPEAGEAAYYFTGLETYRLDANASAGAPVRQVSINGMPLAYRGGQFFAQQNPTTVLGPRTECVTSPYPNLGPPLDSWDWEGWFATLQYEFGTNDCSNYLAPVDGFVMDGFGAVATPLGSLWIGGSYWDAPAALRATMKHAPFGLPQDDYVSRKCSRIPGIDYGYATTFGIDVSISSGGTLRKAGVINQINAGPC